VTWPPSTVRCQPPQEKVPPVTFTSGCGPSSPARLSARYEGRCRAVASTASSGRVTPVSTKQAVGAGPDGALDVGCRAGPRPPAVPCSAAGHGLSVQRGFRLSRRSAAPARGGGDHLDEGPVAGLPAPRRGQRGIGVRAMNSAPAATARAPSAQQPSKLRYGRVPLEHGGRLAGRGGHRAEPPFPYRDSQAHAADHEHGRACGRCSAASRAAAWAEVMTSSALAGTPRPVSWAAIAEGVREALLVTTRAACRMRPPWPARRPRQRWGNRRGRRRRRGRAGPRHTVAAERLGGAPQRHGVAWWGVPCPPTGRRLAARHRAADGSAVMAGPVSEGRACPIDHPACCASTDGRLAALSSSPIETTMGSSSALRCIPPAAARNGIDLRDTPYSPSAADGGGAPDPACDLAASVARTPRSASV